MPAWVEEVRFSTRCTSSAAEASARTKAVPPLREGCRPPRRVARARRSTAPERAQHELEEVRGRRVDTDDRASTSPSNGGTGDGDQSGGAADPMPDPGSCRSAGEPHSSTVAVGPRADGTAGPRAARDRHGARPRSRPAVRSRPCLLLVIGPHFSSRLLASVTPPSARDLAVSDSRKCVRSQFGFEHRGPLKSGGKPSSRRGGYVSGDGASGVRHRAHLDAVVQHDLQERVRRASAAPRPGAAHRRRPWRPHPRARAREPRGDVVHQHQIGGATGFAPFSVDIATNAVGSAASRTAPSTSPDAGMPPSTCSPVAARPRAGRALRQTTPSSSCHDTNDCASHWRW